MERSLAVTHNALLVDSYENIRKQRDVLLEALEKIISLNNMCGLQRAKTIAQNALAKHDGEDL